MKQDILKAHWSNDIYDAFKTAGVRQVGFVPDAGHTNLIKKCETDADIRTVSLTTEEEGIPLVAGGWLGGQKGVLLMQSSGVGNCINMLSLSLACRFPLVMLVTMRGEWGEFNPWQLPMGQRTEAVLDAAGIVVQRAETPEDVGPITTAALRMGFDSCCAVAVLLSQRLTGFKDWSK